MIKSMSPFFSALLLLSGSFLLLSVPVWMAYVFLASITVMYAMYFLYKNSHSISLAWHFLAEFLGFCFLVTLFVATIVIMNGLISN